MKKLILLLLIVTVLSACSQDDNSSNGSSDNVVRTIDANLQVPEKAEKNKVQIFSVTVTQNGKPVEDASEVEFEIWKDGLKDKSEMIKATHAGEGKYIVEKNFEENGVYHIQSHVSARSMHTMPKKEITIGNLETTTQNSDPEGQQNEADHSHIAIKLQKPELISASEKVTFRAEVKNEEQPLEEASVTLVIWQKDDTKHKWIDMSEISAGTYDTSLTFDKGGPYYVNVHVKKDDDHDHKKYTIQVK